MSTLRPRAGVVSYINSVPMIHGIQQGRVPCNWDLHFTTPACISELLFAGEVQSGLVSSFAYTGAGSEYVVLPDVSISSCGNVQSVLLFHNKPLGRIRHIHLSSSSLTSSNLMRLLMHLEGVPCQYTAIDGEEQFAPDQQPEAVMYIGDRALQELRLGRFSYVSDLAALWYDKFHLPFVFALWVVRRDFAGEHPAAVGELYHSLQQSMAYGKQHRDEIAALCGQRIGYSPAESRDYLSKIHYELGPEHLKALKLFYSLLEIFQIIPEAPVVEFFPVPER
ncbi:menaquinone biosynthesis protein [Desulfurispirillum indicum]|uniref:Chorismate dehydratase n=1 Tax=Desulfurispirillum indicum (strain ATCC BAA-1389 / DSM 22839 / S5) TaxID=653733 RepID=E6W436_DESIS|nr:menaquinone biosynthesis protein [Desulfurispirillum indicum]ADU67000.1 protein of unknown function DUF178 [Desulfurispirillum indicum S5]UCZ56293.1 menaquinone biosynthesis protein [Desulfurispirillum indicum]